MRLASRGLNAVGRHRHLARLQPFLQGGLGVLAPNLHGGLGHQRLEQAQHEIAGSIEPRIQIDGTNDGLQRICQDRCTLSPPAFGFTLAQAHDVRQAQLQRQTMQGVLPHQVGTNAGQIPLVAAIEASVQQRRNAQTQHGIAQKLQALVVVSPKTLVCDRTGEQARIGKHMPQTLL